MRGRGLRVAALAALAAGLVACSGAPAPTVGGTASSASTPTPSTTCDPGATTAQAPAAGALFGVSLDWDEDSVVGYTQRLGLAPAVTVTFAGLPLSDTERRNVDAAAEQVAAVGGRLLLTLEPNGGLASVDAAALAGLVDTVKAVQARGVPVIVRYAHEMNGSWYAWGQQPRAYVASFRTVADAVHSGAPGASMMWAPSYGGGYPFAGGAHGAEAGSKDARSLDTNGNGRLDERDDSYAPYYPGDAAVDWVGMSLYHWGTKYPWGENEVPAPGKLVAQLTGRYASGGVDEKVVPDFYATYGTRHGKPVAVTETAALYAPGNGGAEERTIKQAWWTQAFADDLTTRLPRLKMVNWFEWSKQENEIGGVVDWRVTGDPAMAEAFRADLPDWVVAASGEPACAPAATS